MLKVDRFTKKLREMGYEYRAENRTTRTWKHGQHRVYVPKKAMLSEKWVSATLRQCGATEQEVGDFIRAAKS